MPRARGAGAVRGGAAARNRGGGGSGRACLVQALCWLTIRPPSPGAAFDVQASVGVEAELAALEEAVAKLPADVSASSVDGGARGVRRPGRRRRRAHPRSGAPRCSFFPTTLLLTPALPPPPPRPAPLHVQTAGDKEAVLALLRRVAPLYNKLYDAARAAMIPLPGGWGGAGAWGWHGGWGSGVEGVCEAAGAAQGGRASKGCGLDFSHGLAARPAAAAAEALASLKKDTAPAFKYDPFSIAGAADWGNFKDEGERQRLACGGGRVWGRHPSTRAPLLPC